MKTCNSISGGKTSAYMAAHFPADYNVFAIVRIEDKKCAPKDPVLKREAEARTGQEFIATAEEDETMYAVLDLEQYIGKKIEWVTGITFDEVIRTKGGWLPNKLHRYCTTWLKIEPIFQFIWKMEAGPVEMQIGYRLNETRRAKKMINRCNQDGLIEYESTLGPHLSGRHKGKNKWETFAWQKPVFPLIEKGVLRWEIDNYWQGKPVRFAKFNNCVHCFNRNEILLRKQWDWQPEKMEWAAGQEGGANGFWKGSRGDSAYEKIKNHKLKTDLFHSDFSECDSGYCGL